MWIQFTESQTLKYYINRTGKVISILKDGSQAKKRGKVKDRQTHLGVNGALVLNVRDKSSRCGSRLYTVAKLVLEHFGPGPRGRNYRVHYKDGNRLNCHIDNLEWRYVGHLSEEKVELIREMLATNQYKYADIMKQFRVSHATISRIKNRKHPYY